MQVGVDKHLVRRAWQRLLPGLAESYDSQASLPLIAPRPLLIVNGEHDRRCPVAGLVQPIKRCAAAYALCGARDKFKVHIEPGAGHEVTARMDCVVEEFFVHELRPEGFRETLAQLNCRQPASCRNLFGRQGKLRKWFSGRTMGPETAALERRPSHLHYAAHLPDCDLLPV